MQYHYDEQGVEPYIKTIIDNAELGDWLPGNDHSFCISQDFAVVEIDGERYAIERSDLTDKIPHKIAYVEYVQWDAERGGHTDVTIWVGDEIAYEDEIPPR